MKNFFLLCVWMVWFIPNLLSQTALPMEQRFQDAFTQGTRNTTGKPGKNYWQNTADYLIKVDFNPSNRKISGNEAVIYVNNSPDTLHEIVLFLYHDFYKKGAYRNYDCDKKDEDGGVVIESAKVNGVNVSWTRVGTRMIINKQNILPNQETNVIVNWHYKVNKGSHVRTGMVEKGSFFNAYFFPRIAVYDDIDGWNNDDYTGLQEFYNDFCNFKVSITVPSNYVVWATGDLLNADKIFQPNIISKLKDVMNSDSIINIITKDEAEKKLVTQKYKSLTYQFSATQVTDFVFAISDHYVWQSSSVEVDSSTQRRVRVDACFNPVHKDFNEVAFDGQRTVELMSNYFPAWPFPYAHETVFDGLDQMEYPMMVNDNALEDHAETVELTDHEIFHTMFPFYLGVNETQYGWMDEGWATIGEWILSPMIDSTLVDLYGVGKMADAMKKHLDSPIMTNSLKLEGTDYYVNSYPKPAMAYYTLWNMLGDSIWKLCLHNYIADWNGHHPIPYDFFNSINTTTGKNLNWYWDAWFFKQNQFADLSIDSISNEAGGVKIYLRNIGGMPLPVFIELTDENGNKKQVGTSAAVWENSSTFIFNFVSMQKIVSAKFSNPLIPDSDLSNNQYLLH